MNNHTPLYRSGCIGQLEIKNRIVMAPMGSNLGDDDGYVGDRFIHHYSQRAKGGAGLLIVEGAMIDFPRGNTLPYGIGLSDDRYLPGLKSLVGSIHKHGAKAAVQVQHGGKSAVMDMSNGHEILVPTHPKEWPIPKRDPAMVVSSKEQSTMVGKLKPGTTPQYKVLEQKDIDRVVSLYAEGALRAKRAGFDAVELHAAHGYLLASFISAATNLRTDKYGGSLENRCRLLVEVINAVKDKVGDDFPVWIRMNAKEYFMEGGVQPKEATAIAQIAEQAGVDALHVSAYGNTGVGIAHTMGQMVNDEAGYLDFAKQIKRAVAVPIIAVGRIKPDIGAKAIAAGEADFIAMGRQLLADAELPNKLGEGRKKEVRPCIHCNVCVSKIYVNQRLTCAVNSDVGTIPLVLPLEKVKAKKILIVGGGPAGMEAARLASLKGHHVTLCEKNSHLGGTAFLAGLVYSPIIGFVDYLKQAITDLPVDVQLDTEVDQALISKINPDCVLIATGAKRDAPTIEGIDGPDVFSGDELQRIMAGDAELARRKVSAFQRLMMFFGRLLGIMKSAALLNKLSHLWLPLGKRVVIVGDGLVALELAEFLVDRRRQVTVLGEGSEWGSELALIRRWRMLHELVGHDVKLIANTELTKISKGRVDYKNDRQEVLNLEADSVIVASGARSDPGILKPLTVDSIHTQMIGDSFSLEYLEGAVASARRAVAEL